VRFADIEQAVEALKISQLSHFVPVEVFRGGSVPDGKYSILLRATFQSSERTLREEEAAQWSARIVQSLEKLGATLRV
jgi:phenylalanyl-tRNA synthetase beta chain